MPYAPDITVTEFGSSSVCNEILVGKMPLQSHMNSYCSCVFCVDTQPCDSFFIPLLHLGTIPIAGAYKGPFVWLGDCSHHATRF